MKTSDSPNAIELRQADTRDIPFLRDNNIALARETENKRLDPATVEQGVRALIENPERGFYCIAEAQAQHAGSLMITPEWSDWRNGDFWWIQSVYVLPRFRRKGIYSALYDYVKKLARENGTIRGLRLYVEKDNTPAKASYLALGMKESDYLLYEADISTD